MGKITGIDKGTAIITILCGDSVKEKTINVDYRLNSITHPVSEYTLDVNDEKQIYEFSINPVEYQVELMVHVDSEILKAEIVDNKLEITPISKGTAKVKVFYKNNVNIICTITFVTVDRNENVSPVKGCGGSITASLISISLLGVVCTLIKKVRIICLDIDKKKFDCI